MSDFSGNMGGDSPNTNTPTTNTNQADKITAWGGLFAGVLGGAADLTTAISGAANSGQDTTNPAINTQNTTTPPPTNKPNWMLIGGIGLVVVIIGFLIFSKNKNNGRSNSSSAKV